MPTVKSYLKRWEQLKSERSEFINWWRELSDNHLAHRGRFLVTDRNKGHKRNTKQINNASRIASRVLASGMMSGITSPARPWFRLSTGDQKLDDITSVKEWLFQVQRVIYNVFSASNTYNSLHQLYSEMAVFGTGVIGVFEDYENVIRCKTFTAGSYCLATNGKNEVDTFYREYQISVAQCVSEFGYDNCSTEVQQRWDTGNTESSVEVIHVIEPNDDRDNNSPLATDMPWRSVYFERGRGKTDMSDKFLRESGFREFAIMAPRWDVTGEDTYATDCPGMTALGDAKALQLGERRSYQALDKVVNPPLQGPSSMKNKMHGRTLGPNDIVWHDDTNTGLTSIYGNWRPDIAAMDVKNDRTAMRINEAFYKDLFLMLANTDRRQITAREVQEKHEEKLLMLGPVLERLHAELLDPLIDRVFNILQRAGVLPVPPEEIRDKELNIEYVSVLAQAQRLVNTGAIDRLTGFAANVSAIWSEARHKINISQAIDEYADALGVDPSIIKSDDDVAAALAAEQAQIQAQQQGASLAQMAESAKMMSETDTAGESALSQVMGRAGLA